MLDTLNFLLFDPRRPQTTKKKTLEGYFNTFSEKNLMVIWRNRQIRKYIINSFTDNHHLALVIDSFFNISTISDD